jgi:hypothetical protein
MVGGITLEDIGFPSQVRVGANTGNVYPVGLVTSPDAASSGH